ncbi:hypothetical protein HDC93_006769 [Streptomyces sp. AK010]|nr:hypothetical protein [Streptomyces sp. AK010]
MPDVRFEPDLMPEPGRLVAATAAETTVRHLG